MTLKIDNNVEKVIHLVVASIVFVYPDKLRSLQSPTAQQYLKRG
jgi:hypothetical protein